MGYSLESALKDLRSGKKGFCKYLAPNDVQGTGSHQCGIYMNKCGSSLFFDIAPTALEKKDIKIYWNQIGTVTDSVFTYYKSKNEYRLTKFGKGFSFLAQDKIGELFVIFKNADGSYNAYIFEDSDRDDFQSSLGMSENEDRMPINFTAEYRKLEGDVIQSQIDECLSRIVSFPDGKAISKTANEIYENSRSLTDTPDDRVMSVYDIEHKLFKGIEKKVYAEKINKGFEDINDFVDLALEITNRRKSRAGKSFERNLEAVFEENGLHFDVQVKTENNKTCDFLFPSEDAYHDKDFPVEKLVTLGAKTTCKDRWRQILDEADRVKDMTKYLCTLQKGISPDQLKQMRENKVVLVVPKSIKQNYFSKAIYEPYEDMIITITSFIERIKDIEK